MINAINHPQNAAAYGFGVHLKWILEAMTVRNMLPCMSFHMGSNISLAAPIATFDAGNSGCVNIKHRRQFAMFFVAIADKLQIRLWNLIIPMRFVKRHSVLFCGVPHVVGSRPDKKMRWVDAKAIIALVAKNMGFFGNTAMLDKPRDLVSAPSASVHPEKTIPIGAGVSGPIPAFVRLIDKCHKSFWQRYLCHIMLLKLAVLPSALVVLSAQKAPHGRLPTHLAKHFFNHAWVNKTSPSSCQVLAKSLI